MKSEILGEVLDIYCPKCQVQMVDTYYEMTYKGKGLEIQMMCTRCGEVRVLLYEYVGKRSALPAPVK